MTVEEVNRKDGDRTQPIYLIQSSTSDEPDPTGWYEVVEVSDFQAGRQWVNADDVAHDEVMRVWVAHSTGDDAKGEAVPCKVFTFEHIDDDSHEPYMEYFDDAEYLVESFTPVDPDRLERWNALLERQAKTQAEREKTSGHWLEQLESWHRAPFGILWRVVLPSHAREGARLLTLWAAAKERENAGGGERRD